jgi:hypothetical protein
VRTTEYHLIQQTPGIRCTVTFIGVAFGNSTFRPAEEEPASGRSPSSQKKNPRTTTFIRQIGRPRHHRPPPPTRLRPPPAEEEATSCGGESCPGGAGKLHAQPHQRAAPVANARRQRREAERDCDAAQQAKPHDNMAAPRTSPRRAMQGSNCHTQPRPTRPITGPDR